MTYTCGFRSIWKTFLFASLKSSSKNVEANRICSKIYSCWVNPKVKSVSNILVWKLSQRKQNCHYLKYIFRPFIFTKERERERIVFILKLDQTLQCAHIRISNFDIIFDFIGTFYLRMPNGKSLCQVVLDLWRLEVCDAQC